MVISIVIPSFYPAIIYGGTIYASLNNARLLSERGHTVLVSTTNTNKQNRLKVETGKFVELDKNLFVKYYNETIVDKLSLPLLLNLKEDLKSAELIHIQAIFNTPIPVALYLSRKLKKPVLLSPHGVLGKWVMGHGSSFKKIWLRMFIQPFADLIYWHATSELEKREILSHFPSAKIFVIPNAISLEEFDKVNELSRLTYLKKFGGQSGDPDRIIVSMCRLQKKKGLDLLIHSFKIVKEKFPEAKLFIAGEDEGEKDNLLALVKQCRLDDSVFFTGNLTGQDKVDFLGNADLFVLPSHNENFGMVYAESLAAGTPIVASKETPWEEVEAWGCGKWTFNTAEHTSAAMLEMLGKEKKSLRKKCQTYVQRFSFSNVSQEFDKVIHLIARSDA